MINRHIFYSTGISNKPSEFHVFFRDFDANGQNAVSIIIKAMMTDLETGFFYTHIFLRAYRA